MNKRFDFDREKLQGFDYIIGTDEAGRGPGAGPVFAAAVCFTSYDERLSKLNDSKQLSEKMREELYDVIKENSIWAIYQGSVEEIEELNILRASLLSMNRACSDVISKLEQGKSLVLIDGNKLIPNFKYPQEFIIKGDAKSAAIAGASVLAKVARDRFMKELDKEFPQYCWGENKGYMTKSHLDAVDKYGLCKWHRRKFFEKHFEKSKQLSLL